MPYLAIPIEDSWKRQLKTEFHKPYMLALQSFLETEYNSGKTIFPEKENCFEAFNQTPYDKVKVVILGQDPYHGPGQAHGLCFSVQPGVKPPPSLVNIYKEMQDDLGCQRVSHGHLTSWAQQGVLLMNAVMTVEGGMAASHRNRGWEKFTDRVIEVLNQRQEPMVFILWGNYAQKKAGFVDHKKHLVLVGPHPSPLSAHRGFFGCRHFSQANQFLIDNNQEPIDWELPSLDQ